MPAPYTQQQLDAFWATYHTMNQEAVRIATTPGTDGYLGPDWAAMLFQCRTQKLYGFADYGTPPAGGPGANNKYSSFQMNPGPGWEPGLRKS